MLFTRVPHYNPSSKIIYDPSVIYVDRDRSSRLKTEQPDRLQLKRPPVYPLIAILYDHSPKFPIIFKNRLQPERRASNSRRPFTRIPDYPQIIRNPNIVNPNDYPSEFPKIIIVIPWHSTSIYQTSRLSSIRLQPKRHHRSSRWSFIRTLHYSRIIRNPNIVISYILKSSISRTPIS